MDLAERIQLKTKEILSPTRPGLLGAPRPNNERPRAIFKPEGQRISVRFPHDGAAIEALKSIGASWDKARRLWSIGNEHADKLEQLRPAIEAGTARAYARTAVLLEDEPAPSFRHIKVARFEQYLRFSHRFSSILARQYKKEEDLWYDPRAQGWCFRWDDRKTVYRMLAEADETLDSSPVEKFSHRRR